MFTKFLILSSLSLVVNCVVFDMVYSMRYVDGIRVLRIVFGMERDCFMMKI